MIHPRSYHRAKYPSILAISFQLKRPLQERLDDQYCCQYFGFSTLLYVQDPLDDQYILSIQC